MEVKKLEGARVYLAPVIEEDLETFVAFMNDMENTLFTGTFAHVYGLEEERAYFKADSSKLQLAIHTQVEGRLIGIVELMGINWVNRSCEIGISVGRAKDRSQGYGREAMALMLDHAFGSLNLHSVYLSVFKKNLRAQKLYASLGFKEAGLLRENRYVAGAYEDTLLMDLLREDYAYYRLEDQRKIIDKFKEG